MLLRLELQYLFGSFDVVLGGYQCHEHLLTELSHHLLLLGQLLVVSLLGFQLNVYLLHFLIVLILCHLLLLHVPFGHIPEGSYEHLSL